MLSSLTLPPRNQHKKSKRNPEPVMIVEDQDDNDADEYEIEEIKETELFGELVSQMIEMEEFFRLSMGHENELTEYLKQAPDDLKQLQRISNFIQHYLSKYERDHRTQKMDSYVMAFNNMMNNEGRTMLIFMQKNGKLATFLENKMDVIEKIYVRYLKYSKSKLEAALKTLNSEQPELELSDDDKTLTFLQKSNTRKRLYKPDVTDYDTPISSPTLNASKPA